tara:strand:- start:4879 stop:5088 length:210 start_codon:yes stop_codon:yes gene_type:complete
MPNKIIKPNGVYIKTHFKAADKTFILVGSKCIGRQVLSCLDTFKCVETKEYGSKIRAEIFNLAESGTIK